MWVLLIATTVATFFIEVMAVQRGSACPRHGAKLNQAANTIAVPALLSTTKLLQCRPRALPWPSAWSSAALDASQACSKTPPALYCQGP